MLCPACALGETGELVEAARKRVLEYCAWDAAVMRLKCAVPGIGQRPGGQSGRPLVVLASDLSLNPEDDQIIVFWRGQWPRGSVNKNFEWLVI